MKNYSDLMCDWLVEQGYTHCFFVAGGNVMHLLNSARVRFTCIPVVHEVTAGIAAEYFNELDLGAGHKAFALVTAGPGLTNIVTAIAGAHLESRSLLVIGGQVKNTDLSRGEVRQRGIQEIDGVSIVKSICKVAKTITEPISKVDFLNLESETRRLRKGVVFLEVCLDVQGTQVEQMELELEPEAEMTDALGNPPLFSMEKVSEVASLLLNSQRPIFLIGGGISREDFRKLYPGLSALGVPMMGTWNGADRIPNDSSYYWGRPNTWGMRYSNILIQQSDLVIAIGTRLGLQHTGFNWQEFAVLAKVIHVDIDESEIEKGHPRLHMGVHSDAAEFLLNLLVKLQNKKLEIDPWLTFGNMVKENVPLSDPENSNFENYWNPYHFMKLLTSELKAGDVLIPSSSGAAETVAMQSAVIPEGAFVVTNKGLASMGYGLAGAIGATFKSKSRVFHVEGDGGFAQNVQDLGTVSINELPIKTFIFDNGGYASIKMTQKSYFQGNFIGCDLESGLGLPKWEPLFAAYGISCRIVEPNVPFSKVILDEMNDPFPRAFLVPIHQDQTYYPKITSRVLPDGKMASNPLHLMTPDLTPEQIDLFLPYLKDTIQP